MTSTGSPEVEDGAEDHAYFRAVEEAFVRLRGAPLLLSPADWQVARRWRHAGVPLEVVRRTLEEVFTRRRERGARGRIQSLRYCAPAVEEAWREIRDLAASGVRGAPAEPDVPARLRALAAALPAELEGRAALVERLTALRGAVPEVEARLAELDEALLTRLEAAFPALEREALAARVDGILGSLAGRIPAAERAGARRRLFRQALRSRLALPILSLFSPEAEGGESR